LSLLEVKDLSVCFHTRDGDVRAVDRLNFSIDIGETLGIVGESGSGKSQSVFAIMGLLAKNGRARGSVKFEGREILNLPESSLNQLRMKKISIIFQDSMTALNPYMKIKKQLMEVLIIHKGLTRRDAYNESLKMLDAVKIPEAKKRMDMYPHEFSGGMRQRVMIAMSILCEPQLLIADEPTTALDVTIQAQILALLNELRNDFNTAIILITHDLGVVASLSDHVMVMYAGQTMESGTVEEIFYTPSHPYTISLLKSMPKLSEDLEVLATIPGNPPNMLNLPRGCLFEERCFAATSKCQSFCPNLVTFKKHRQRACFFEESKYV